MVEWRRRTRRESLCQLLARATHFSTFPAMLAQRFSRLLASG